MDVTTDREREIANALVQIEKLRDVDVRAILRHLATDDAVFSEAQCSYIARVIDGTLYKEPRDAVNATMRCSSGLTAAYNWERSHASYPYSGHVPRCLRAYSDPDADKTQVESLPMKQPSATRGDEDMGAGDSYVVAIIKDTSTSVTPPNIINKGHLTIHHHYHYNQSLPDVVTPTTVHPKRERDQDDKQCEEASDDLKTDYQPKAEAMSPTKPLKRARLQ